MRYFSTDTYSHHHQHSEKTYSQRRYPRGPIRTTIKDHLKRLSESEALVKTSRLLRRWTSQRSESNQAQYKPKSKPHQNYPGDAPTQSSHPLTRRFKNNSSFIKIIRFEDTILGFQERVVFPGQTVFLNLDDHALVRIKSSEHITNVNVDTIHSYQLPLADFERNNCADQQLR